MTQLAEPRSPQATVRSDFRIPTGLTGPGLGAEVPAVDDWERLRRFLAWGREDGSYRVDATGLSLESAHSVFRCLVADGPRVVRTIVEVVETGRAARPEPALFVLALAAADRAAGETRSAALAALPQVCRTGAQLLHFARYVDDLRGWGRGLRRAVAAWYRQPAEWLAREVAAAPVREGWTHRDLLRLAHPQAPSQAHQELFRWIVRGWSEPSPSELPELRTIYGCERVRKATDRNDVAAAIREHSLTPQLVPETWLDDAEVWLALVEQMSTGDLIRNLEAMARRGLLTGFNEVARRVAVQLGDAERVRRSGVQPFAVLATWRAYASGGGGNSMEWTPVAEIVDALEVAFHHAIGNTPSTGRRWLVALDISGSTGVGETNGIPAVSPRETMLTIALSLLAAERKSTLVAFTAGAEGPGGRWGGLPQLVPLDVHPGMRLAEVVRRTQRLPMGGVDCAYPMEWARRQKLSIDVFAVFTDSETWSGRVSAAQALREYRERMGIAAKLVVVGMTSEGFRVADPADGGMLDIVGFDAAAPGVMADFAAGGRVA